MTSFQFGKNSLTATIDLNLDILKLQQEIAKQAFYARVRVLLITLNKAVLARTAVWEGETIANWRWSSYTPDMSRRFEIQAPDETGHTNAMALGEEPRRAANSLAAGQSLAMILGLKDLPTVIYFSNPGEVAMEMEMGMVPVSKGDASGFKPRTKGMLRLSVAEAHLFKGL